MNEKSHRCLLRIYSYFTQNLNEFGDLASQSIEPKLHRQRFWKAAMLTSVPPNADRQRLGSRRWSLLEAGQAKKSQLQQFDSQRLKVLRKKTKNPKTKQQFVASKYSVSFLNFTISLTMILCLSRKTFYQYHLQKKSGKFILLYSKQF